MSREFRKGGHAYYGRFNDRFKRMFSKLGVKKEDLSNIFEQIENEKDTIEKKSKTKNC